MGAAQDVAAEVLGRMAKKTKEIEKCQRWAAEADTDEERRSWLGMIPEVEEERDLMLGAVLALQVGLRLDLGVEIREAMGWPKRIDYKPT